MAAIAPRRGLLIVGGALLLISLFLPWFGFGGRHDASATGWEFQTTTDVFLAIMAVIAAGSTLAPARLAVGGTTIHGATALLGGVATILLLWLTLFDFPEFATREIGLYLAIGASAALAFGAYIAAKGCTRPRALTAGRSDDASRPTSWQLVAGAGGALLFISLFLPWFSQVLIDGPVSVHGWEGLPTIDAYFLITAVVGVATALQVTAAVRLPETTMNGATAVLGGVATILLVWFLAFDFPNLATREIGPYLGLIAAVAIAVGGLVASRDEPKRTHERAERPPAPIG